MPRKNQPKKILIIAGPNGAGKTTFALEFLPHEAECTDFINADLIARALSPLEPEKGPVEAGKIVLTRISRNVSAGQSFAFETTLAGLSYSRHIPRWREAGYCVKLFFPSLPIPELAVPRVAARAAQGGHHVPEDIVRRRFDAGLKNFQSIYCKLVNEWALYDSSTRPIRFVDSGRNS